MQRASFLNPHSFFTCSLQPQSYFVFRVKRNKVDKGKLTFSIKQTIMNIITIITIIRKYWHFFVIAGLVIWLVLLQGKVTDLTLQKSVYMERIEGLNATQKQREAEAKELRKKLQEINTKITDIYEIYNSLPKDKDIKDRFDYLTPDASWNNLLFPIEAEINNPRGRYYLMPE